MRWGQLILGGDRGYEVGTVDIGRGGGYEVGAVYIGKGQLVLGGGGGYGSISFI